MHEAIACERCRTGSRPRRGFWDLKLALARQFLPDGWQDLHLHSVNGHYRVRGERQRLTVYGSIETGLALAFSPLLENHPVGAFR